MPTSRVGAAAPVALVKHALLALTILLFFFALPGGAMAQETLAQSQEESQEESQEAAVRPVPRPIGSPTELHLIRAASPTMDLRNLAKTKPEKFERPEFEEPEPHPVLLPGGPKEAAAAPIARRAEVQLHYTTLQVWSLRTRKTPPSMR